MNWKYALIKIKHSSLIDDDYCELVELFDINDTGNYKSFCTARIHSIEELKAAYSDVMRDGVNTWFVENGEFSYLPDEDTNLFRWNWTESKHLDEALDDQNIDEYEEEMELYKVYGGD
jgi:hypothetical protein